MTPCRVELSRMTFGRMTLRGLSANLYKKTLGKMTPCQVTLSRMTFGRMTEGLVSTNTK